MFWPSIMFHFLTISSDGFASDIYTPQHSRYSMAPVANLYAPLAFLLNLTSANCQNPLCTHHLHSHSNAPVRDIYTSVGFILYSTSTLLNRHLCTQPLNSRVISPYPTSTHIQRSFHIRHLHNPSDPSLPGFYTVLVSLLYPDFNTPIILSKLEQYILNQS